MLSKALNRVLLHRNLKCSLMCARVATDYAKTNSNQPNKPVIALTRSNPGEVIWGLVPREWATFFHAKSGVTGFYTFCFTFGIYLASKEKLVMEHEYYGGLSTLLMWYLAATRVGPGVAKALDKDIDDYETAMNDSRVKEKTMLEESVADEKDLQSSAEGQLIMVDAKRENVELQLEAEFRSRQMMTYGAVKKRLDYQLAMALVEQRLTHRNLIEWVTKEVLSSYTPEFEKQYMISCIENLERLVAKR